MPSGSDFDLAGEDSRSAAPTINPLTVEPMMMPMISGAVSGAETSADRPSKTPRMPPSSRPNTGLLIFVSLRK